MPSFRSERRVRHTAQEMFDLVADVERYPEFVPLCTSLRVRSRKPEGEGRETLIADMSVGYKMIRERFTSRVSLDRDRLTIEVTYADGPFKQMTNRWRFEPTEDGRCRIDFYVAFEFRSAMLQKLIGVLFHEAVRRMVGAFETRARKLYGPPHEGGRLAE